jgi:hypothetical protein
MALVPHYQPDVSDKYQKAAAIVAQVHDRAKQQQAFTRIIVNTMTALYDHSMTA